jgi:hypothetical protein
MVAADGANAGQAEKIVLGNQTLHWLVRLRGFDCRNFLHIAQ